MPSKKKKQKNNEKSIKIKNARIGRVKNQCKKVLFSASAYGLNAASKTVLNWKKKRKNKNEKSEKRQISMNPRGINVIEKDERIRIKHKKEINNLWQRANNIWQKIGNLIEYL